ncbi:MAG: stage III sporulation protein AC [Clostridia bacterium]|nr:stage III sporulation protein AC [Clostridia bacterium]
MDVDLILKIAGIGIIVAVINLLLAKSGRDEQALMTTLAGIVVVLLMLIPQMGGLIDSIKEMFGL